MAATVFHTRSIYGARTGLAIVGVQVGDGKELQISPDEARRFAAALIDSAHAAEMDRFMAEWLQKVIKADPQQAAALLAEFREARERFLGEEMGRRRAGR